MADRWDGCPGMLVKLTFCRASRPDLSDSFDEASDGHRQHLQREGHRERHQDDQCDDLVLPDVGSLQ